MSELMMLISFPIILAIVFWCVADEIETLTEE